MKDLARTKNHYKDWDSKSKINFIDDHTTFLNLLTELNMTL